jgi:hypothetical protein
VQRGSEFLSVFVTVSFLKVRVRAGARKEASIRGGKTLLRGLFTQADPLRLKSVRNQLSSGHPRIATTRIATIGVPIATMAARIACQWSNQSTTQSLRSKSGSLAMFAAMRLASSRMI